MGAPLLELLFDLAERMQREGMTLHVIGDLAMYFWHLEHHSAPRTTDGEYAAVRRNAAEPAAEDLRGREQ